MKISIRKPIGYSQIGRKDQQEDAVWPSFDDVSASNPCIVLCDGVGGSEHGEIASQTSSRVIGEYLTNVIKENNAVSEADLQEAVNQAYDELERIDTASAEGSGMSMATTLTCVCFHPDGILAAHMGDSRIYHVRPGQGLLYQSADHSLVNALLQVGEITIEEAKTFPRKNVITKAIQPHTERRFKAEVQQLTDVQSGDYVFLCCDGVLEQLTNERLVEILSMDCSDEEKLRLLEAESTDRTRDNYTAYLIPIDEVQGVSSIKQEEELATVVVESAKSGGKITLEKVDQESLASRTVSAAESPASPKKKSCNKIYLFAALAVVALVLVFCLGRLSTKSDASDAELPKVERRLPKVKSAQPKKVMQKEVKVPARSAELNSSGEEAEKATGGKSAVSPDSASKK